MSDRHRWMRPAVVLVLAAAGGVTASGPTAAATPGTAIFVHTGDEQQWVVPAGVTSVRVVATGAAGGRGVGGGAGGAGARAAATVPVTPGSVLYVEVGGVGADGVVQGRALSGGFNGGGASVAAYGQGGSGGGASDVRTVPRLQGAASLPSRLVTAAGGAGGGGSVLYSGPGAGGAGDADGSGAGATGGAGPTGLRGGAGASQTAPGAAGSAGSAGAAGTGGSGGGAPNTDGGGGGGGGLYGGGGGAPSAGGGGGSSGFDVGATDLAVGGATGAASLSITWTPAEVPTAPASAAAAPETAIGRAPGRKVSTTRPRSKVTVTFSSPSPGAAFECSLDAKAFAPCTSPAKLKVRKGRHLFAVRAVLAGVADPTPATVRFEVRRRERR